MATEVYNWVQKYDADLETRQVSKLCWTQRALMPSAAHVLGLVVQEPI